MSFGQDSYEDSILFQDDRPMSLMERLGYVKQLVFSRTRLEFRILWNKVFQKEDEELGWLLNPYRESRKSNNATMMASFNKNVEEGNTQFGYDDVGSVFGRERVTIYNRGLARKGDARGRKKEEKKSITESALEVARCMGMGVYMTSTSFPSPFLPVNDASLHDESIYTYEPHYTYTISKIW